MSRLSTYLCLLMVGVASGHAGSVAACQCGPKPPVSEALARSPHVFIGVVTAIEPAHTPISTSSGVNDLISAQRITLRVGQRWKGASAQTIVLHSLSDCAFSFTAGQSYLVFAEASWFDPGYLEATKCLPTALRSKASEIIRALGPPLQR
jgi:hypothetical protein